MSGNELPDNDVIELETPEIDQDIEQSVESSDLATEKQQEPKRSHVEFTPEQQEVFDKAIGKKTWEVRETERRLESERQERLRIEAELAKFKAPVIDVPPMPDPYEEGFEQKLAARDQAIALRAAYNAQQEQIRQAQALQQQQEAIRKQKELEESVETYKTNAVKLGVKQEELEQAAQTVAGYGINEDLALAIIGDEHGALITTYLANNINDLDKVVRMSPIQAAMYIANEIKPKAIARKPKVSSAPDPVTKIGGSVGERSSLPKGYSIK